MQGSGVMGGNILQVNKPHVRRPGHGVAYGGDRRYAAARKNIAFDEIHGSPVPIK